jgi:O-methyltransferase
MTPPYSAIDAGSLSRMAELARRTPPGCFCEVGVYKGGSAWYLAEIAREQDRKLHLFDTFTGIPHAEPDDSNAIGEFSETTADEVRAAIPDAEIHVGVFPSTMPWFIGPVAFVHCDCDQYASVRAVIDTFWPEMVSGGIIVFDDENTTGGKRAIKETFGGKVHNHGGRHYVVKE